MEPVYRSRTGIETESEIHNQVQNTLYQPHCSDSVLLLFTCERAVFSGHHGIVKDATDQTARVELHSVCQTISVDRSRLALVGFV